MGYSPWGLKDMTECLTLSHLTVSHVPLVTCSLLFGRPSITVCSLASPSSSLLFSTRVVRATEKIQTLFAIIRTGLLSDQ